MDNLPTWVNGNAKKTILDFVDRVTVEGSPDFVPESERIAVFDNDGTLWCEKPYYVQGLFAFDRVNSLVNQHPEWNVTQPFQAVLERDWKTLEGYGNKGLCEIFLSTHSNMTSEDFSALVSEWINTKNHAVFNRRYDELVYAPMRELLDYLRAYKFKTFIVSGGGIEFVRVFCEKAYGIPPEQVIGSSIITSYEVHDGVPRLFRQNKINFIDDKEGKPVGIHQYIGRRPIAAFGNSDGDFAMLEWVTSGAGARLGVILHHDDGEREFAYDRNSASGGLDLALKEAPSKGWTTVSMRNDWKKVFSFAD